MASEKISAMPDLSGGQVPTDLIPLVDLSAAPPSQNVRSTLNDLFGVITKNVSDGAVRYQAPGSPPSLSVAGEGAIYFDGSHFRASENGGTYRRIVHAGLITTSGLTQATASILGRTTAGTGAVEEITIGAGLSLAAGSLAVSGVVLTGPITTSGLTQATARILGRTTAGTGAVEEITIGAGLSLAAGSLAVSGVVLPGPITTSGLTQATARMLGRTTAGTGAVEEISIGSGLTLSGGQLSASGGAPGGSTGAVQYNGGGGTFGGSSNFVFNPSISPTVDLTATGAAVTALRISGAAAQTAEIILVRQGGDNASALLTLQQGILSTLTNNFPFRFENASGTLLAGIAATPATGNYRFVVPGQGAGNPGFVVGGIATGSGIGVDSSGSHLTLFSGGTNVAWCHAANGNFLLNQAYELGWTTNPTVAPDVQLVRMSTGRLRVLSGANGGAFNVGATTSTTAALEMAGNVGGVEMLAYNANRTTVNTTGTTFAASTQLTVANTTATAPGAVYAGGANACIHNSSFNGGVLQGLANFARHNGTGSVSEIVSLICYAYLQAGSVVNRMSGIQGQVEVLSTGTTPEANGFRAFVNRGSGTITNGYGLNVNYVASTNAYGVFVGTVIGSAFTAGVYVSSGLTNYAGSATWTVISDQRVKTNIRSYERGLDTLLQLAPKRYEYNGLAGTVPGRTDVSLIAQEVLETMPELIAQMPVILEEGDSQPTTIYTLNASDLIYTCINAIKQLHERTTIIESKVTQ